MKNSEDSPTSNWGMQAVKEKFQLPENAVIMPQSESQDQLMEETLTRQKKMRALNERAQNLAGKKFDQDKPRMELLPPAALNEVSKVLAFGADKYGDHNWRDGLNWSRLCGASLRHILAWSSGETNDPESGLNHLAHAACNILMLIESAQLDIGKDDRWKK